MRCVICDQEDDKIRYDPQLKEFGPCCLCTDVIFEALSEFEDEEENEPLE